MRRAKWPWMLRVVVAVLVGFAVQVVVRLSLLRYLTTATYANTALQLSLSLLTLSLPVLIYALLTWRYGPRPEDVMETRCRECGYILRGITEPRCPECGESI